MIGCNLVQHYGTTETWIITVLQPEDHDIAQSATLASCGVPVPFVKIRVVDARATNVERSTVDQILVQSPSTFSGYLNQPEATTAVMQNTWYTTGDLGFIDKRRLSHPG